MTRTWSLLPLLSSFACNGTPVPSPATVSAPASVEVSNSPPGQQLTSRAEAPATQPALRSAKPASPPPSFPPVTDERILAHVGEPEASEVGEMAGARCPKGALCIFVADTTAELYDPATGMSSAYPLDGEWLLPHGLPSDDAHDRKRRVLELAAASHDRRTYLHCSAVSEFPELAGWPADGPRPMNVTKGERRGAATVVSPAEANAALIAIGKANRFDDAHSDTWVEETFSFFSDAQLRTMTGELASTPKLDVVDEHWTPTGATYNAYVLVISSPESRRVVLVDASFRGEYHERPKFRSARRKALDNALRGAGIEVLYVPPEHACETSEGLGGGEWLPFAPASE